MKKIWSALVVLCVIALCIVVLPTKANAATSGEYTYTVSNGEATITDVNTSISGNITIPSKLSGYPVTSIGSYAFSYCRSLTSVTIPDSVTSIGDSAFNNCISLTSITIPDCVTSIGDYAFNNCISLTSITIPDSVTSIGNYAFSGCSSLTSVIIGDGVTSIGDHAFSDCSSLSSVTIGDSVTSIGDYAFSYCSNLTGIYISDIAAWCNVGFSGYDSNPLYYAKNLYLNGVLVTDLVIPDSVTSIGRSAFAGCGSLTSITIPASVTTIGDDAFAGCSSLTSVTIPDSVTSIGDYAFSYCRNLTSVTIGDSVTSIGVYSFSDCSSLSSVTIGDSVTSIGDYAFSDCSNLTSVTIPDSVTTIGDCAFCYCSKLTSITIPDSVTSIGDYVFLGCSSLQYNIYKNCEYLGNPDNPYLYFEGTTIYTDSTVVINSGTRFISASAFSDCRRLTSVTIPDSVTSIGRSAFAGCSNLTSIIIPDSVTSIGERAFYECSSLQYNIYNNGKYLGNPNKLYLYFIGTTDTAITDCVINSGTRFIYSSAFAGCSNLTKLIIPDSVTSIGNYAFSNCSILNEIIFQGDAPSIGSDEFYGMTTTVYYPADNNTWTENVKNNYGGNITWIAYTSCGHWTAITVPGTDATCTEAGKTESKYCPNCGEILLSEEEIPALGHSFENNICTICGKYMIVKDGFEYDISNSHATVINYTGSAEEAVIPDTIEGYPVTSIGPYAFRDCSNLTKLMIPNSITSIGEGAFDGCTALNTIVFQGDAPSIGDNAFYQMIATAYFPANNNTWTDNVKNNYGGNITWEAYSDCKHWDIVTIPGTAATCTEAGKTESKYCPNCGEILLSEEEIPALGHSFENDICTICGKYMIVKDGFEYDISNSHATVINYSGSAAEVIIPDAIEGYPVTGIGSYAFRDCSNLTKVTIPDNITSIGEGAFDGCTALNTIVFLGDAPKADNVFSGVTATVYYSMDIETWTAETREKFGGSITWVASGICDTCEGSGKALVEVECTNCHGYPQIGSQRCSYCYGTGGSGGTVTRNCALCSGKGQIKDAFGKWISCFACGGRGSYTEYLYPCSSCGGDGYVTKYCSVCTNGYNKVEANCEVCVGKGTVDAYYVYFHTNGGTGMEEKAIIKGNTTALPNTVPTKPGYVFMGWKKLNSETVYHPESVYTAGETTLYAIWHLECTHCNGFGEIPCTLNCSNCEDGRIYYCTYCGSYSIQKVQTGYWGSYHQCNSCGSTSISNKICSRCEGSQQVEGKTSCAKCSGKGTIKEQPIKAALPVVIAKDKTSVTLKFIEGYEYSMDGINWQENPAFENLESGTKYTFYQRMAVTNLAEPGIISDGLNVFLCQRGDMDENDRVDNKDVEYLLWHTLFPTDYPLTADADFDGNSLVDNRDVEYLLWHTLFPVDYPLD